MKVDPNNKPIFPEKHSEVEKLEAAFQRSQQSVTASCVKNQMASSMIPICDDISVNTSDIQQAKSVSAVSAVSGNDDNTQVESEAYLFGQLSELGMLLEQWKANPHSSIDPNDTMVQFAISIIQDIQSHAATLQQNYPNSKFFTLYNNDFTGNLSNILNDLQNQLASNLNTDVGTFDVQWNTADTGIATVATDWINSPEAQTYYTKKMGDASQMSSLQSMYDLFLMISAVCSCSGSKMVEIGNKFFGNDFMQSSLPQFLAYYFYQKDGGNWGQGDGQVPGTVIYDYRMIQSILPDIGGSSQYQAMRGDIITAFTDVNKTPTTTPPWPSNSDIEWVDSQGTPLDPTHSTVLPDNVFEGIGAYYA